MTDQIFEQIKLKSPFKWIKSADAIRLLRRYNNGNVNRIGVIVIFNNISGSLLRIHILITCINIHTVSQLF